MPRRKVLREIELTNGDDCALLNDSLPEPPASPLRCEDIRDPTPEPPAEEPPKEEEEEAPAGAAVVETEDVEEAEEEEVVEEPKKVRGAKKTPKRVSIAEPETEEAEEEPEPPAAPKKRQRARNVDRMERERMWEERLEKLYSDYEERMYRRSLRMTPSRVPPQPRLRPATPAPTRPRAIAPRPYHVPPPTAEMMRQQPAQRPREGQLYEMIFKRAA